MAFFDVAWYVNSVGYAAVTVRPQNTAVVAGIIRRQFTAPAVGSERCFVCVVAGTTANTTDATWNTSRGTETTDGTAKWREVTGVAAMNGDATNTMTWTQVKTAAVYADPGVIIKRDNGVSYQLCTATSFSAFSGTEPAFSDTAGTTVTAGGYTWVSLGPVGNFTGGMAPFARLASACASGWFVAGNTAYVAANHAETQNTSISISVPASTTTVGKFLCHNQAGSYPPASGDLTTGATISTGTSGSINFTTATFGALYCLGLAFKVGTSSTSQVSFTLNTTSGHYYFENCSFQIASTFSGDCEINMGADNSVNLKNCTLKFGGTTHYLRPGMKLLWQNNGSQLLETGSAIPAALVKTSTTELADVMFEGLDLGAFTGSLFATSTNRFAHGSALFEDCKLNAGVVAPSFANRGVTVQLVRCDSAAAAYRSARYAFEGAETTETTITRVGGAVDPSGQAQARKIVTTANAQWLMPFKAEPYAIWNTTAGATVTVTVYGTINAGAVPNNDDIWLEVEYLGSAATPVGSIITTTKANLLTANAAVASDGSSWNGGGSGAGWSPFKLVATLSSPQPAMVGYLNVRVRAAKASATFYIDPKIALS